MSGSLRATRGRLPLALLLVVVLALYVVPFAGAAPAALPLIDHFDSAQGPLSAVLGTPASSSVGDANVLGGERDILVTVQPGSFAFPSEMRVFVANSLFSSSQDAGVFGQALIAYDGPDGNPSTLAPTGLGGIDLTQGGTNNGFEITSRLADHPVRFIITVYTDANSASSFTISLPGTQDDPTAPPIAHYVEFAAFAQVAGATGSANFASVGAITLLIDGYTAATDVTIEDFRVVSLDWGDLLNSYGTTYASNGPRHVIGSLYLGAEIDSAELDGVPTANALGDDNNHPASAPSNDDEDGVTRVMTDLWQPNATVTLNVAVTGGPGVLGGWFDWNNDGDVTDDGEFVNFGSVSGPTVSVTIPTGYVTGTPISARFRLFDPNGIPGGSLDAGDYIGFAVNGEVEDYRWEFGPNAVNLSAFAAAASPVAWPWVAGAAASATVLLAGLRRLFRS